MVQKAVTKWTWSESLHDKHKIVEDSSARKPNIKKTRQGTSY